jgi:serine/threonine-protein kinase RsbW
MIHVRQLPCRQEAKRGQFGKMEWQVEYLRSARDKTCLLNTLASLMAAQRYRKQDVFAVSLALEEAVANAVKHGHGGDVTKPVRVRYHINGEYMLVEIRDSGPGFDPRRVPDPRDPGNRERCTGRGVYLLRHYATWLRYNERGTCLTFCRLRSLLSRMP